MQNNLKIYLIIGGIALTAIGFSGGYYTGKVKSQLSRGNFQQFNQSTDSVQGSGRGMGVNRNGSGQGMGRNAFQPISGEITAVDDKSVTVKTTDGSSKIVMLSDTTKYSKAADAAKTDLKTGEKIAVFGQSSTDGTVTAQTIEFNPAFNGQAAKAANTQ